MIICCPQLGISPESNLGGEVYDREIIKGLDNLGLTTLIILPLWKKTPLLKHAKIYRVPLPFIFPPIIFNFLIVPYLFYLKHKYNFNVLRIHNPYFVGIGARLFGIFHPKVNLIPSYLHLEKNPLEDFIDKKLIKSYKRITTISKSTKKEIVSRYRVKSEIIELVPCGVDKKYKPEVKDTNLLRGLGLENKKILLYLGQLIPRKNIPFLLDLMHELPNEYILLIVGSGHLDYQIDDKVKYIGKIDEQDKVKYYNLADIFVYPTLKEGFGLSVCEALNCGIKVIATELPVFKEIRSKGLFLHNLNKKDWLNEIKKPVEKDKSFKVHYNWAYSAKKFYEISKK